MYLKLKGAIIKHNGVMNDNSTKITLFLNEMTDEEASFLYNLAKGKEVDVLITPSQLLDELE